MTTFAQLTFDGMDAPSAKIIAIAKVERNADPAWIVSARAEVDFLAHVHDEFTTDAVWQRLDNHDTPAPREPRALGAVMRKAAVDGLIASTGRYQQSEREECHNRPVAIWCSLVR